MATEWGLWSRRRMISWTPETNHGPTWASTAGRVRFSKSADKGFPRCVSTMTSETAYSDSAELLGRNLAWLTRCFFALLSLYIHTYARDTNTSLELRASVVMTISEEWAARNICLGFFMPRPCYTCTRYEDNIAPTTVCEVNNREGTSKACMRSITVVSQRGQSTLT